MDLQSLKHTIHTYTHHGRTLFPPDTFCPSNSLISTAQVHTYIHTYVHTFIYIYTYIHTTSYIRIVHTSNHNYINKLYESYIHTYKGLKTYMYIHTYIHTLLTGLVYGVAPRWLWQSSQLQCNLLCIPGTQVSRCGMYMLYMLNIYK